MRHSTPGLACAVFAAFVLAACGGNSGSGPPLGGSGGGTNTAPTANAGASQSVAQGVTVTLNGTASSDPDGSIASYAWTQTAGTPAITLTGPATAQPTFTAPTVVTTTAFTFSLMVTDDLGATSAASTVTVTVNPPAGGNVNVTGTVTFARVLFQTATNRGLDYGNQQQRPARGVLVRAVNPSTPATVFASATTDNNGNYSLTVAANTSIAIEVVAQMQRTGALPNWNVTVRNGLAASPYTYSDPGSFNSSAGITRNIAIPSGIASNGTASGPRSSGPFAILDTIFKAQELIRGVEPAVNFPPLIVDWGTQNIGTFFTSETAQHIALLGNLNQDTDEFDEHVIAHEFGHYIEFNFSRADNIGGSHALGNRLDPRVAFGEGFGYAFAAMVLDDPGARDSYVSTLCAPTNQCSGYFDIERNPGQFLGTAGDSTGCWCSESSVWSILWDVFDSAADTNDTLALGFAPIWTVLNGAQRTTPALTTIFSFVTALKAALAAQPAQVTALNTLVAAQNITASNIDAFGSTETNAPAEVQTNGALPVFRSVTLPTGGTPATVLSVNDAATNGRSFNKLGSHRFLRFTLAGSQSRTIVVTSPNPNTPDPDFVLYRNGVRQGTAPAGQPAPGQGPPATTESFSFNLTAGDYVLDVYECANGCDDDDGTEGDFNLSVAIN